MRNRSRRFVGFVVVILIVWGIWAIMLPVGKGTSELVKIPEGTSAGRIGDMLAEKKLIHSGIGFRLLARATGKSAHLKPGTYRFRPQMAPSVILDMISRGEVAARWITFPEGYTVAQIADRLQSKGIINADTFISIATNSGSRFSTRYPHPTNLEGYLFPDTYLIQSGITEQSLISQMLEDFRKKVYERISGDVASSGMSLNEVITMASLIEREAKVPKDRPLVSAVIHNRLKKNMKLEIDATVLYALGRHKDRVFFKDLKVDSPYNTYLYAGLPPGPIANPGLASIEAALHPANVEYIYYVARKDGSHIFSSTFEEHQRAKASVR